MVFLGSLSQSHDVAINQQMLIGNAQMTLFGLMTSLSTALFSLLPAMLSISEQRHLDLAKPGSAEKSGARRQKSADRVTHFNARALTRRTRERVSSPARTYVLFRTDAGARTAHPASQCRRPSMRAAVGS
jgi:hypothetical protein